MKKIYLKKLIKEETNKFLLKKFIKENRHLKTEKQLDEAFARFTHLLNESYTIEEGLFDSFNKTKEAAKAVWNKLKGTLKGIGLGALMSFVVSSGLSAQDVQKMDPVDLQNKVERFTEVTSDKGITTNKYDINKTEYGAFAVEPKIATDKASEFQEKINPNFTRDVTKIINQIASIDKNGYPRYKLGSKMEVRLNTIINAAREAMLKRDVGEDTIVVNVPQYGKFQAYNIGDRGVVVIDGLEYLVTKNKYEIPSQMPSKSITFTQKISTPNLTVTPPDIKIPNKNKGEDSVKHNPFILIIIKGSPAGWYDLHKQLLLFRVAEEPKRFGYTKEEKQRIQNIARKYGFKLNENGFLDRSVTYVYDVRNKTIKPFTESNAPLYGYKTPEEIKDVMKRARASVINILSDDEKVLDWNVRNFERYFKMSKGYVADKVAEYRGPIGKRVDDKTAFKRLKKDLASQKKKAKELAKQRREIEKAKLRKQRGLD